MQVLRRDNGTSKNISFIDKKGIRNNCLQIINQYEVSQDQEARHNNHYNMTALANGLTPSRTAPCTSPEPVFLVCAGTFLFRKPMSP